MKHYRIKYYKIHLKRSGHTAPEGGPEIHFRGYIETRGTHEDGTSREFLIFFLDKSSNLPAKAAYKVGNERIWGYAFSEDMPVYIDVLRNESPTAIVTDDDRPEYTEILTAVEEAGEGE